MTINTNNRPSCSDAVELKPMVAVEMVVDTIATVIIVVVLVSRICQPNHKLIHRQARRIMIQPNRASSHIHSLRLSEFPDVTPGARRHGLGIACHSATVENE